MYVKQVAQCLVLEKYPEKTFVNCEEFGEKEATELSVHFQTVAAKQLSYNGKSHHKLRRPWF